MHTTELTGIAAENTLLRKQLTHSNRNLMLALDDQLVAAHTTAIGLQGLIRSLDGRASHLESDQRAALHQAHLHITLTINNLNKIVGSHHAPHQTHQPDRVPDSGSPTHP